MPNAEKIEKVTALKERIEGAQALLLAEYRGLSVHDATELRRSLSEQARFAIVKNTLFRRAAADAGVAELEQLLDGPTAVAFVDGDVVAAAKKVVDAAKKFPALVLKGGYLDGKLLSAAEAQALATLESREILLSRVAGMMKAQMSQAASMSRPSRVGSSASLRPTRTSCRTRPRRRPPRWPNRRQSRRPRQRRKPRPRTPNRPRSRNSMPKSRGRGGDGCAPRGGRGAGERARDGPETAKESDGEE